MAKRRTTPEPPAMSETAPTEPGYYWWRQGQPGAPWVVVRLYRGKMSNELLARTVNDMPWPARQTGGFWVGPILPPAETPP